MRKFTINGHEISDGSDAYVIAEVGHNHQGKLDTAMEMFKSAKDCGAHAVKLQKRDNKLIFTEEAYNKAYNSENAFGATYGEHREALEFGRAEYDALRQYTRELGLDFISTAFDQNSADFLAEVGVEAIKVASGDLTNTPLLKHLAGLGKPVIVSTGGAYIDDVQRAYDTLKEAGAQFSILQCTAAYPCEPIQMNLRVISTYRERFPDVVVGLSDHQNGIAMAVVAYTLGARIMEKHFTLNRAWKGSDHSFSLEPGGLRRLVRDLSRARVAMGDGIKRPLEEELAPLNKMRKSIVAAADIPAGTVLTMEHVAFKCPGDHMQPYEIDSLLGKTLNQDVERDQPFTTQMIG